MLPPVCLGEIMSTEINNNSDRMQRLHSEALQLPETPGVYIMHDASDKIIYVGKSRNLRNRVSQYFGNNEKNAKTARMVASVRRFECIHCDTEIEALTSAFKAETDTNQRKDLAILLQKKTLQLKKLS